MARTPRLPLAQKRIEAYLDALPSHVLLERNLQRLFQTERHNWSLPQALRSSDFIEYLLANSALRRHLLIAERPLARNGTLIRYTWRVENPLEIALSIRGGSYLSHATAVYYHALNDTLPKVHYVNKEQSPKPSASSSLTQDGIDRAFSSKKQRTSTLSYKSESGDRYVVLAGKNTKDLGVVTEGQRDGSQIRVTDIERTLIDIVVRAEYAGGVEAVADAYVRAKSRASVSRIIALLRQMNYLYPYHQPIGFYAENAGFDSGQLERLKALGLRHNFYLTYGMSNPRYVQEWKLFVPEGM